MKIKHILGGLNLGVVILFVFAGVMLFQSVPEVVIALKPAVNLENPQEDLKPGAHFSGRVPLVFGCFASESTYTQRSDGSRSGSKPSGKYYVIPTAYSLVALKGRQVDVAALDRLEDETLDFFSGGEEPSTEFFVEGKLEALEPKLAGYFREYLTEEFGATQEDLDLVGEPLVIRYVSFTACWVLTGIGLALAAVGALLFRRGYRTAKYGSGLKRAEDLPDLPGQIHTRAARDLEE